VVCGAWCSPLPLPGSPGAAGAAARFFSF
jgi:hypothetical protein